MNNNVNYEELRLEIQAYCKKTGTSFRRFSEKIGASHSVISHFVSGRKSRIHNDFVLNAYKVLNGEYYSAADKRYCLKYGELYYAGIRRHKEFSYGEREVVTKVFERDKDKSVIIRSKRIADRIAENTGCEVIAL